MNMNNLQKAQMGFVFAGAISGLGIGYNIGYQLHALPEGAAQPGYVTPSKLEIVMEDLDKDGQKETLFEYEGKKYLLLYDETTGPKIAPYELKPAQLVVQP